MGVCFDLISCCRLDIMIPGMSEKINTAGTMQYVGRCCGEERDGGLFIDVLVLCTV